MKTQKYSCIKCGKPIVERLLLPMIAVRYPAKKQVRADMYLCSCGEKSYWINGAKFK